MADERKVLVLQGGGALGAYQAGAFQRLAEAGEQPDWVAGISIGAINAALICGNRPEARVAALETFWHRISAALPASPLARMMPRRVFGEMAAAAVLASGAPGFFTPRLPAAALMPGGLLQLTSFYDTTPLHRTLEELVDFDYLNREGPRLSVGAVDVQSGNFAYFDSAEIRIRPEHIMASGALPPGFPAVKVAGRSYWDGGLVSNTPLQYVMERRADGALCIFQVDLFNARGPLPQTMDEVQSREKDIRFSSRTRLTTDRFRELAALRAAAERLYARLPDALKDDPDMALLRGATPVGPVTLVHLIHRRERFEGAAKDYEFSRLTMQEHWAAGERDVRRTLGHPAWAGRVQGDAALTVLDLTRDAADHANAG